MLSNSQTCTCVSLEVGVSCSWFKKKKKKRRQRSRSLRWISPRYPHPCTPPTFVHHPQHREEGPTLWAPALPSVKMAEGRGLQRPWGRKISSPHLRLQFHPNGVRDALAHLSSQRCNSPILFKPTPRLCSLLSLLNSVVHSGDYLQIKPRVSRGFMRQSTRQECSLPCQISLLLSFFILFLNITHVFFSDKVVSIHLTLALPRPISLN